MLVAWQIQTVDAQSHKHPNPLADSQVPITGWPYYVENLTKGSPVADFGSHYGLKASVTDDGCEDEEYCLPASAFLNTAHYAAYSDLATQLDQSYFALMHSPDGIDLLELNPAREVFFTAYGWTERSQAEGILASASTVTVDTDLFLQTVTLRNTSSSPISFYPTIVLLPDQDPIDESLNLIRFASKYTVELGADSKTAFIRFVNQMDLERIFFTSFTLMNLENDTWNNRVRMLGERVELDPNQTLILTWVFCVGRNEEEIQSGIERALTVIDDNPRLHLSKVEQSWNEYMDSLPEPHADEPKLVKLFKMAATGLRMNVYAPRNRMTEPCSVPAKAHFNKFWGWDTAFQAMARAEFDPELAKQELSTLFSGPLPRAFLEMGDDLIPAFGPDLTQPPVQGWAIADVYRKDGRWDTQWLTEMYEASRQYLQWWLDQRDPDGNGLFHFTSGFEVGWDDSPRYHCQGSSSLCLEPVDNIEPLDLNVWLYTYFDAMRRLALELELDQDWKEWETHRDTLAAAIETFLWDTDNGTYFDLETNESGYPHLNPVLTPAMFFPLFAGITTNPQRAKSVLENYLLEPSHFWGYEEGFPVPTVAFSDESYDWADDGFYWQGQSWMVTNFVAATALYRYGYEEESRDLVNRILEAVIAADPGGIYEAYDSVTGQIGFGTSGRLLSTPGEPAAFQFGWSCSFIMEMLLGRQEIVRYLMPGETGFTGYTQEVSDILTGRQYFTLYDIASFPPFTEVQSMDGRPLDSQPKGLLVRFTDPYGNMAEDTFTAYFSRIEKAEVFAVAPDGQRTAVKLLDEGGGIAWQAELTSETLNHYELDFVTEDKDSHDESGCGGCNSTTGDSLGPNALIWLIISWSLIFLVRRRYLR